DEAVRTLDEFGGDPCQPSSRVAQRQPRPSREIAVSRGAVAGEVPARELRQGAIVVRWSRRAQPVANQHVGMLAADHWTAYRETTQARQHQEVNERLIPGRYPN